MPVNRWAADAKLRGEFPHAERIDSLALDHPHGSRQHHVGCDGLAVAVRRDGSRPSALRHVLAPRSLEPAIDYPLLRTIIASVGSLNVPESTRSVMAKRSQSLTPLAELRLGPASSSRVVR